jgi:hypothetical protein
MSAGHTPRKDIMSTAQQRRPRSNWVALGVVGSAVVAATLVTTGAFGTAAAPAPTHSAVAPAAQPSSVAKPNPQPTKTATIKGKVAVPIKPELAATVTGMTAVQGEAQGPGEIAGPAVKFTIAIKNDTGKPFNLANTVVNAYSGADASPAEQLTSEGTAFPKLLKDGESASAQFVFTIPEDERGTVLVTVDTSVQNPVVAFRGSAPR